MTLRHSSRAGSRIVRGCISRLALLALLAPWPAAPAQGSFARQDPTPRPPPPGEARDAELDALAAEIGNRLRCLVCRGQSVTESSSRLARDMQSEIRERLARGETPEEIEAFFVESYGEWILLQPPARGVNLLVYVLPAAVLLLGLFLVLRRIRARAPDSAGADAPSVGLGLDPEDRAWLEAAIREREEA